MTPTQTMLDELQLLLSADTASLAAATALHVHLLMAPFTPGPSTDFTTLTEATFNTYAPLNAGTGAQQKFRDPTSGQAIVQMKEPAGGWHWQAGSTANLPQTIFGFAITDTANAVTWGSALLPAPVTLTNTGDAVDIGQIRFAFALPVLV